MKKYICKDNRFWPSLITMEKVYEGYEIEDQVFIICDDGIRDDFPAEYFEEVDDETKRLGQ